MNTISDLYDFELRSIDGTPVPLARFRGQVLLIVNVASQCGFTPQYEELEALHREHEARGFAVLGIPANEFGAQEPGSNSEIREFCTKRYGVTFPLFEKIVVKGPGQHPLYEWLTAEKGPVTWNFNKFLIDRHGRIVERFESDVTPRGPVLEAAIEHLLEHR